MKAVFGIYFSSILLMLAASAVESEASKYLLPGNVLPSHYQLHLLTKIEQFDNNNEDSFVFDGHIVITLRAIEDNVTSIALNSDTTITMHSATLLSDNGTMLSLATGNYDNETTILIFEVEHTLPKNEPFNLTITYSGRNQGNGRGLSRTSYTIGSETRWLLATQFQPVFARRAFPCFDEPKYKAIWTISISLSKGLYDRGYNVLSNAQKDSSITTNGIFTAHFKPTPLPLSSYLIAIIISDYKSTTPAYFNSSYPVPSAGEIKELRTWARADAIDAGEGVTAQTAGPALLEIFTKNFNIGYGYRKLDQAAVPGRASAMENWGLVIYSEAVLDDSDDSQPWVVTLLAHELAHQWFGDLTTLHWWSDIWLNEGFATYTEYFGAEQLNVPGINVSEWKILVHFIANTVQHSLGWDFDDQHHALTVDVYNPVSISSYFDPVAYKKGGSILWMWRNILGVNAFHKALHHYFLTTKESVSTPELLLSSLDTVAEESASDFEGQLPSQIFRTWHLEQGYPVVTVRKSSNSSATYVLTQEKYVLNNASSLRTIWTIPISYSTSWANNFNKTYAALWLKAEDRSVNIELPRPVEWIVLNNQEGGYYRVNYDEENWDALFRILNNSETLEQIHEINRMQILDDSAFLAQSTYNDYLSYNQYLNMATYLKHEKEYYVWISAINNLKYLNNLLAANGTTYPFFKKYLISLMLPHYSRLTIHQKPTDTYLDKKLRSLIINWMCKMGHSDCIDVTRSLLHKHLVLKHQIDPGARRATYCTGAKFGNHTTKSTLLKKYLISTDIEEKSDMLSGLGCMTHPVAVKQFLQNTIWLSSEIPNASLQDILLSTIEGSPTNARIVFKFLKNNTERMAKKFQGRNPLGMIIEAVSRSMWTEEDILEMTQLVSSMENSNQSLLRIAINNAKKALVTMKNNNAWIKKKSYPVYQWLKSNY